ncbi:MAG: TlpA disulfide reductase family protein [Thermodesulfovibrionales bacterium]
MIHPAVFAKDKKAVDFVLNDIYGKSVRLSELRGKTVLLHFWAMWCGDCVKEMPSLNNLHTTYRDNGLEVVSISTDVSVSKLQEFAKANKIGFMILHDPDKVVTIKSYSVVGLPVSVFIDKHGNIIERINGPRDWNSNVMKRKIQSLLKDKK